MVHSADNVISTQFGQPSQVLGQCRSKLSRFIDPRMQALMQEIDDSLFKRAEQAGDGSEQNLFFDGMRQVRLKREQVLEQFSAQLSESFNNFLHGRFKNKTEKAQAPELELSLVENDSLEQDIAIDGMTRKVRAANADVLYLIRRRLESVTARRDLAEDVFPMDPASLADNFRQAIDRIDLPLQIQLIIFKLFEQQVLNTLAEVYQQLNELLLEKGILPDLEPPKPEHTGTYRRPEIPQSRSNTETEGSQPGDGSEVFSMLQQAYGSGGQMQGSGPWNVPGGLPGAPGMGSGPYPAPGAGLVAATPDVLSALSTLQHQIPAEVGVQGGGNVSTQLITTLTEVKGQEVQSLDPVEQTTIDVVSTLFDFVFDDPDLNDQIKMLIGRLQIPVIKVAVLDKGFFARKNNPARKLLNTLSRASDYWGDDETQQALVVGKIESVVNLILEEFEDDVVIFEQALNDFEQFLSERQRQVEELEEQSAKLDQGKENLAIAKAVSGQSIEQLLSGGHIPPEVEDFLRTTWKDLLVIVHVRHGSDSIVWKKVLNVAVTLVWSLQDKSTQEEREDLKSSLPALIKSVKEGMKRMSVSEDDQKRLLASLLQVHARLTQSMDEPTEPADSPLAEKTEDTHATQARTEAVDQPPSGQHEEGQVATEPETEESSAEVSTPDGASFLQRKVAEINQMIENGSFQADGLTSEEDADMVTEEDAFLIQAREMPNGTWLEVSDDEGSERRIKLSWRSMISGKIFFVNHQGIKVQEMSMFGLAALLRKAQARVLDDAPVMDRAFDRLFSSLPEDAASTPVS
jgi:anti-sigma28 factor (negative regulator of flagellin synthesis)